MGPDVDVGVQGKKVDFGEPSFGPHPRRPTVLIRIGGLSFSKKAFILGITLAFFQVLDGLLTWLGLRLLGVEMEGNAFLQELMKAYGGAMVLFVAKTAAITFVILLTIQAHSRRWIRPVIAILAGIYLLLAVVPWALIITNHYSENSGSLD